MANLLRALVASFVVSLAGCAAPSPIFPTRVAVPTPAAASTPGDTGREQLHAVLWMQTSEEYRAITEQTWRLATERLPSLRQPGSAATEQASMDQALLAALPTALIVDLDETVLDNSFYQARQARARRDYDDASWNAWMEEAAATAIPGAREFLRAAAQAGIRVFYVTNRECQAAASDPCPQKRATLRNLAALGLPGAGDPDSLLLRRERPEWNSSDKGVRRGFIGERYRIVALGGDDLNDFVDRRTFAARREELSPLFGTRWFLLPNAMYGSWERALSGPACSAQTPAVECPARILERKYELLESQPPPLVLEGPAGAPWSAQRTRLRLATWNVEYLVEPATYAALADRCVSDGGKVPGAQRSLPCAIVPRLARDAADFAVLRRYAAQLDADVVALQEVDGPATAARVFPGHEFCFSSRPNVQKNGFAIRRGLPFRCESEYLPLSLDDRFRRGVVVTLFPGEAAEMTLMNVHLKSGCPEGPMSAATDDCAALSAQVAPLEAWIDAQARMGRRFAVLGDFNRRLSRERGPARDGAGRLVNLWPELDDRDPPAAALVRSSEWVPFRQCIAGDPYTSYIDEIVLSRSLAPGLPRDGGIRITYAEADARKGRMSDHCPVGVEISLR